MNITVLLGTLSSDPKLRVRPSGDELITYEVTTELADGAVSVLVAWLRPSRPLAVAAGDVVVVIGRVRRRFFRAATRLSLRRCSSRTGGVLPGCSAAAPRPSSAALPAPLRSRLKRDWVVGSPFAGEAR
ncbi:MAG: hypothetical protein CL416_00470 [Acidimicrobiaceae bacterium]|nr:hypothetical protein [Acidimicrobiaceae bacterium]|tara:strand:+ start:104 stop:490 length:387 start_codon:yes stop_codon:yes gene_type:complete